jgi:GntR family transcriptional regulator, histidine utilization repressor
LIERKQVVPPLAISGAMQTPAEGRLLHLTALHLADDTAYALEDRWINTGVVPDAAREPFDGISANEWLLRHAPYTHGEIAFSAASATEAEATVLSCPPQSALFAIERLTWDKAASVTRVRLLFRPGHKMRTVL